MDKKKYNTEYYQKTKEIQIKRSRQWREDNQDKVKEQNQYETTKQSKNEWVKKNPDKRKESVDKYYEKNKLECNKRNRINYQKNRVKYLLRAKLKYEDQRNQLYEILGGKICIKCGYDGTALNFEHINDDGPEDKKRIGGIKKQVYYYLNHPDEAKKKLQVYCANCNWEKELERR